MSKPEFVYVTYIETTPEKLWQALTDTEFSKLYWFGTEVRSDWKVGSSFALVTDGITSDTGEILVSDPPRQLAYTFRHARYEEMRDDGATKVTFTIEPHGGIVKLTVTHQGFAAGSKLLGAVSNGWPAILSGLKSLLETGHAVAIPMEALGKVK